MRKLLAALLLSVCTLANAGVPYVFATMPAGNVAASTLDADFAYLANSITCSGGDPTGVSDSTTAIQTCLNSIATGTKVIIPPGQFKITSALNISNVSHWQLVMVGTLVPTTTGNGPGYWEVADFTNPQGVLNVSNSTDFSITPNIVQTNVSLFGNGNVIYVTNSQRWSITGGVINVACNIAVVSGKAAIRIGAYDTDWRVSNGYFRGWYGILAGGSTVLNWNGIQNGLITGNEFVGNGPGLNLAGGIGVSLDSFLSTTPITNVVISNNIATNYAPLLSNTTGFGYSLASVSGVAISGNSSIGGLNGIHIEDATGVIVSNNLVTGAQQGIAVDNGEGQSGDISIIGNHIIDSVYDGIQVIADYGLGLFGIDIDGNDITWTNQIPSAISSFGIVAQGASGSLPITNSSVKNNTIINNTGANSTAYGIYSTFTQNSDIHDNKIVGYHTIGALIGNAASGVGLTRVDRNTLSGTFGTTGIQVNTNYLAMKSVAGNSVTGAASPLEFDQDAPFVGHVFQTPANYNLPATGSFQTMATATVYANAVSQHKKILIKAYGNVATNARAVDVRIQAGGTTLVDAGSVQWSSTGSFYFQAEMDVRDSATQRTQIFGNWNAANQTTTNISSSLNFLTTNQAITFQGNSSGGGAATTDIVLTNFSVEFID